MPRRAEGYWDERKKHYYAKLGKPSPTTGKPTPVLLRHQDGRPIAYGDTTAVADAVRELLAGREERRRKAQGPTVEDLCSTFLAWHVANGSARRTVETHEYNLRRFKRFVWDGVAYATRPAASIEPADLWAIKKRNAELRAKGEKGWGALRHLFASVLACWRWASDPIEGRTPPRIFQSNPLAGIKRPKTRTKVVEKLVDWRASRKLLRFARAHAKRPAKTRRERTKVVRRLKALCLTLIAETGCRPFEAYALRRDEIRWKDSILVIDPERTKPRGRDRRIAVSRRILQALKIVCGWKDSHATWVFAAAWNKSDDEPRVKELDVWFRTELRTAALAEGVPIPAEMTLYWLRHDWQTAGLEVESAEGVADAAGNSPGVLLSTYAHKKNRRVKEVAEKVRRLRRSQVD